MTMFHLEDVLHLGGRERLLGMVRQHPIVLFRRLLWALLFLVLPFFAIFPLISWGTPGMILFLGSVLFGAMIAIRGMLLWNAHVLIATTNRLVCVRQQGLFSRYVTDVSFEDLTEPEWEKSGIVDTLFRLGTIVARPKEKGSEIRFTRVSRPQEFIAMVHEARHPEVVRTSDESSTVLSVLEIMDCINALSVEEREELFNKCGIHSANDQPTLPVVKKRVDETL